MTTQPFVQRVTQTKSVNPDPTEKLADAESATGLLHAPLEGYERDSEAGVKRFELLAKQEEHLDKQATRILQAQQRSQIEAQKLVEVAEQKCDDQRERSEHDEECKLQDMYLKIGTVLTLQLIQLSAQTAAEIKAIMASEA